MGTDILAIMLIKLWNSYVCQFVRETLSLSGMRRGETDTTVPKRKMGTYTHPKGIMLISILDNKRKLFYSYSNSPSADAELGN